MEFIGTSSSPWQRLELEQSVTLPNACRMPAAKMVYAHAMKATMWTRYILRNAVSSSPYFKVYSHHCKPEHSWNIFLFHSKFRCDGGDFIWYPDYFLIIFHNLSMNASTLIETEKTRLLSVLFIIIVNEVILLHVTMTFLLWLSLSCTLQLHE